MLQVVDDAELTALDLPKLEKVTGNLYVRARPHPHSADRARAAARIAPSLPC